MPDRKRNRRRWFIAILVVLTALVWWQWPRADDRFVGRWEISNTSSVQPIGIMEMHSNGRGRTTFTDDSGTDEFFWLVEGDEFQTGAIDGPVWQTIFRQFFARLWMKLAGTPYMRGVHELRIDRVTENEIRLLSEEGLEITYRRVTSPDRGDTD